MVLVLCLPLAANGRFTVKRKTLIALAAVAFAASAFNAKSAEQEPAMKRALAAPAPELAQGYLAVKFIVQAVLPMAKMGAVVHLGSETINKSNVDKYERKYERRLSTYREAIKQRGYQTISGTYQGKATEACARVHSMWAQLIVEKRTSSIEITQDGFDAQVVVSTEDEGRKIGLRNRAAVAESGIALQDGMNSDYYFRGTIEQGRIELKPDVSVLRSWPNWAGPPRQKDLENCTVTLEGISKGGRTQ
jgi:hypothetical protein